MTPPLALGQAVHEVLESLSVLHTEKRFERSLIEMYEEVWQKVSGEKGGFWDETTERKYKERGAEMLRRVMENPGPLKNKAVKIRQELPHFWLSTEYNIILCGKIDWLEYLEESDSVHIVDFKTGKSREKNESLQLPIYLLLVANCQKRKVEKASYWYLGDKSSLDEVELPEIEESKQRVLKVAKQIALARKLNKLECPKGKKGCRYCLPYEKVLMRQAKLVGVNDFNQDVYIMNQVLDNSLDSDIL